MKFKKYLTYSVVASSLALTAMTSSDYDIANKVHAAPIQVNAVQVSSQKTSAWAKPYVNAMNKAGLVPGSLINADLTQKISREEFAELMTTYVNKVGGVKKSNPGVKFSDTNNPLVIQSAEMGIVEGVGNSKFEPKQNTNREQIATMAYRGEKLLRPNIVTQKNTTLFNDGHQVSEWAKEGVGTMQAEKVIEGVGGGYFKPKDTATREQAIKIVAELAAKKGFITINKPVTPTNPTPQNPVTSKPADGSIPLNKYGIPENPKPTPQTIAGFTPDFRVGYHTKNPELDTYFDIRLANSIELKGRTDINVRVECVSHPQLNNIRNYSPLNGKWNNLDMIKLREGRLSGNEMYIMPRITKDKTLDIKGNPIVIKDGEVMEYRITMYTSSESKTFIQYIQFKDKNFSRKY